MAFMINLGYGNWSSFALMGKWWPLLLIILGLGMFWQGRIPRLLAYILVTLAVAGVVGYMAVNDPTLPLDFISQGNLESGPSTQEIYVSKASHPNLKQGELKLNYGGGRLNLSAGSDAWLQGRINSKLAAKTIEVDNDKLRVILKAKEDDFWPSRKNGSNDRLWSVKLAPELNWRIDANIGAVAANLDLSNINLQEFKCNLGAGALDLNLGNNGPLTRLDIRGGASSINMRLPAAVGVKVTKGAALISDNLDEMGWRKNGNSYLSPNYEQAASRIDLELHLGAGSFDLQQY